MTPCRTRRPSETHHRAGRGPPKWGISCFLGLLAADCSIVNSVLSRAASHPLDRERRDQALKLAEQRKQRRLPLPHDRTIRSTPANEREIFSQHWAKDPLQHAVLRPCRRSHG